MPTPTTASPAEQRFETIAPRVVAADQTLNDQAAGAPGEYTDQLPKMAEDGGVDASLSAGGRPIVVTTGEADAPIGFGKRIEPGDSADIVDPLGVVSRDEDAVGNGAEVIQMALRKGDRAVPKPGNRGDIDPKPRKIRRTVVAGVAAVALGISTATGLTGDALQALSKLPADETTQSGKRLPKYDVKP